MEYQPLPAILTIEGAMAGAHCRNRPLHMWLDVEWVYGEPAPPVARQVREIVHEVFREFESGSMQQVIYRIGTKMLQEVPQMEHVRLEANSRTWDTIGEEGNPGVYTDPRPPFGVLGLTLTR